MFLSASSKFHYGLIFLSLIASQKERVSTQRASELTGISQGYLEEIASLLRKSKIIVGKRGLGGGYALVKSPSFVSLKDVFEALEGPLAIVSCVSDTCSVKDGFEYECTSRLLFTKMQRGFQNTLQNITLAQAHEKL